MFPAEVVIHSERWADQLTSNKLVKKLRRIADRDRHCPQRKDREATEDCPPEVTSAEKTWPASNQPCSQRQIYYRKKRRRTFGQTGQASGNRKTDDVDLVGIIFRYDRGREHPGCGK